MPEDQVGDAVVVSPLQAINLLGILVFPGFAFNLGACCLRGYMTIRKS